MSFDAGSIIGTADLDRTPFNAGLDLAKRDAESFEARTWQSRIGLDAGDFDAKFDDEQAKLDRFSTKTVTATAEIDVGDGAAKLTALDAALDAFGKRKDTTKPQVDSSGVDKGLDDIKNKAADAAGSDGLGLLLTTALSVGPAIIPVGAELLAGLAAIAPMALAAGAGIGAFALAGAGDLGTVEKAAESTLKQFQALNAPTVLPVIAQSIGFITPAFAALVPLVSSTAGELSHLEDAASSAIRSPFWNGFITFLAAEAPPAINAFTSLLGGLVKSFAGISIAFAPVISDVEGGMDGFAARIAAWGQGLGSSNGFVTFLHYVETEGPVVGNLLVTLGGTLEHLAVGAAPVGAAVLTGVDALSKLLDVLTGISPYLTTTVITVAGLALAYSKLHGPIEDAASALSSFFKSIVDNSAKGLTGEIAGMVASLGGIAPASALAAAGLVAAAAIGIGVWRGFHGEVSQTVDAIEQMPTSTLPQLNSALSATEAAITKAKGAIDDTQKSFVNVRGASNLFSADIHNSSGEIDAFTGYISVLQGQITQYNNNVGLLQQQTGLSRDSVISLADSIDVNLSKALTPTQLEQFNAALQKSAANAQLTTGALSSMANQAGISASALSSDLTNAANTTKTAWAGLGNAISAFSSGSLPATQSNIAAFYATSELQGAQFTSNIQKAISDGYSPVLIEQILQAGPAQASSLLQGMVSAQGTGLKNLINQATAAMTQEGAEAVEEARLTEIAVTAKSSTIAAALPTALSLSQALTTSNAAAQVEAIANSLSGGLPQLLQIAKEYGIALPAGLQQQVDGAINGGTAQAQAVAQAMRANQSSVAAAALAVATALPNAANAEAPNASTAAAAQIRQFINGATAGGPAVSSTMKQIMEGALVVGSSVDWTSAGRGAAQGIAQGMELSQSYIDDAAANLMLQGLAAAKSKAGIHSPSTVWAAELGLPMAQGVVAGWFSGAPLIFGAISSVLGAALNSGEQAAGGGFGAGGWSAGGGGGEQSGGPGLGGFGGGSGIGWSAPGGLTIPPASGTPGPSIIYTPQPNPLDQVAALAAGYANARSAISVQANPVIQITVPNGTNQEQAAAIAAAVSKELDNFASDLTNEMAAL